MKYIPISLLPSQLLTLFTTITLLTGFSIAADSQYQPLERHAIISMVNFYNIIQLDDDGNITTPPQQKPTTTNPEIKPTVQHLSLPEILTQPKPHSNVKPTLTPESLETTRTKLSKKISINLSNTTLTDAIDHIADSANVSILTNWNELDLMDISREEMIELTNIKQISAAKALNIILQYVSPSTSSLIGYTIDDEGTIYVKHVRPDHYYNFKTYYIGDLVRPLYNPLSYQGNYNNSQNKNNKSFGNR